MTEEFQRLKQEVKRLLKESKWIKAQGILLRMHNISPNNEQILIKMAHVEQKLNNNYKAKYYYNKGLEIDPFNSNICTLLGMLYEHKLYSLSKAETYYIQAIEINAYNDHALFNLATLYTKNKKYHKAYDCFIKCLVIDANKAAVHHHYGVLLCKMKNYNEAYENMAYEHFKIAVQIKPNIANYQLEFAKLSMKLGYVKQANKSFQKSLELSNKQESKFLFEYAIFCKNCQKYKMGLFYIEKAMNLEPNNTEYNVEHDKMEKMYQISGINNDIKKFGKTVVYAYISYHNLELDSSILIPLEVQTLCYNYLIGNYSQYIYAGKISDFEVRHKQQVINVLSHILCSGRLKYQIIIEALDLLQNGVNIDYVEFSRYYNREIYALFTSLKITKKNQFKDVTVDRIFSLRQHTKKTIKLLKHVNSDSNLVYQRYTDFCKNNNYISSNLQNIVTHFKRQMFTMSKDNMRRIAIPMLFKYGFILYSDSSLMMIQNLAVKIKDLVTKDISCIILSDEYWITMYWLLLEIRYLEARYMPVNTKTSLNVVIHSIWDTANEVLDLSKLNSFYEKIIKMYQELFELLKKYGVCLKPFNIDWETFYNALKQLCSRHKVFHSILLEYCSSQQQHCDRSFNKYDKQQYCNWVKCVKILNEIKND